MSAAADGVAGLWARTLEELGERLAHELKNALNGVAVNVEVVRARAGADASRITPFAEIAATELEGVVRLTESLLWLVRPLAQPVDVGAAAARLAVLGGALARTGGGRVVLEPAGADAVSGASADVVRLLLAAAMLRATASPGTVCCVVTAGVRPIVGVRHSEAGMPHSLTPELGAVAHEAGVGVECHAGGWTFTFPSPQE